MSRIISHPFRLTANGDVATVDQDSEQADREQVAVLALTVTNERPITPGFGVTAPEFGGYLPAEIAAGVAAFGPADVVVRSVDTSVLDDTTQIATIEFE